jgi:hypothetical protein
MIRYLFYVVIGCAGLCLAAMPPSAFGQITVTNLQTL